MNTRIAANVLVAAIGVLAGIFLVFLTSVMSALITAFVLTFALDPFLAVINIPFLTERFAGIGFGKLFVLVFTIRLITGVLIPARDTAAKTGGGE
jgi:hypothetical protein